MKAPRDYGSEEQFFPVVSLLLSVHRSTWCHGRVRAN
jgi:hypothetical protein